MNTIEIAGQDCSLIYDTSVLPKALPTSYSRLLSSKGDFLIHNYFLISYGCLYGCWTTYGTYSLRYLLSQPNPKQSCIYSVQVQDMALIVLTNT